MGPRNHVLDAGPDPRMGSGNFEGRKGGPFYRIGTLCRELCNKCSAVAEMGDCLATIDMGRQLEVVPLWWVASGYCVPMKYNNIWDKAYLRTKWHLDPSSRLATTDMGRKLGAVPLGGGAGSASNTKLPGPRPTIVLIGILINSAVWSQLSWAEKWGCAPFRRWSWVPT